MSGPFSLDPNDKDIVEKVNKEFNQFHEEEQAPPPPQTMGNSGLDKIKKLSSQLGVDQLREDMDVVKSSIDQLSQSQQQIIESMNNIVTAINNNGVAPTQQAATTQGQGVSQMNPENIQALVGVVDTLVDTWKKVKGGDQVPQVAPLISQEEINRRMQKSFMDDLDTGESIRQFITNSLKKKATQNVINESMKNIGAPDAVHGPE